MKAFDSSGKGTQARKIVEYLESKGKKVKLYSFPQYNTIVGSVIAKYLQGSFGNIDQVPYKLICIAYAADRASVNNEIRELLSQGVNIVVDRYTYSNLFTAAKLPEDEWSVFIKWVETMEFDNLGIIKPDYNFYLYIDPYLSAKRISERGKREYQDGKEDIHESNQELLIQTAKCYLDFAQKNDNWFIIDQMENNNQLSLDRVFEKIKNKLDLIF